MMGPITEFIVSAVLIIGAGFMLIGSIGLAKLPDFFTRLHAPTKASTLGVGCILVASIIYFSVQKGELSLIEMLITLFLLITAPISAHMLAKAGLHYKAKLAEHTQNPQLTERAYQHQGPEQESDEKQ